MLRNIWKPALALGAVLAVSGAVSAGDNTVLLSGTKDSTTMTLGGSGTASQAATEDTELAAYRGGYHGGYHGGYGYRGWHGGYGGYRGGYYGGYRGGYGRYYAGYRGYYGGYRGGYYGGWGGYYRPFYAGYYGGGFYRPYYGGGYYSSYPLYSGSYYDPCAYLGISGGAASGAPVVNLGTSFVQPVQPTQPVAPGDGTFPYDGGPASPVPQPLPDTNPIPPASPAPTATDLPISGKSKSPFVPATTPYKYKAYGEK